MSFYEEIDTLNTENDKPTLRYLRCFNNMNMGNAFRTLELSLAVVFLTWSFFRSSPYLSASFHLLSAFLRRLSSLALNHHFVFLLGNSIIAALFLKFSHFHNNNNNNNCSSDTDTDIDTHIEYQIGGPALPFPPEQPPVEKLVVDPVEKEERKELSGDKFSCEPTSVRRCRRSRSEVFDRKKIQIKLRRSETEPRRSPASRASEDDGLSNEEFRRKVDEVIERHRRSLREESSSSYMSSVIVAAGICT